MSMFDIEVPASSVTKSIEKQPVQESILPKKINNDGSNNFNSPKDAILPSTAVDGNVVSSGIKSTLVSSSHVM